MTVGEEVEVGDLVVVEVGEPVHEAVLKNVAEAVGAECDADLLNDAVGVEVDDCVADRVDEAV